MSELYNVRKIMLRGNEISKFDADVLSNYDDKKTVLSSYLVKQLISKQTAKGTEFDNSITSKQEMWKIKTTTSDPITEFSIFEQEEGVKMQPIKLATGKVEETKANIKLEKVILTHTNFEIQENSDWSFAEVEDFYKSVYPKQFVDPETKIEKLGLMVVDFSQMNLQQLSEIHIPKLIKVEIPNVHDSYDAHWFIPVAVNTPIIEKDIFIDAPSILMFNPREQETHYYKSDDLGINNTFSNERPVNIKPPFEAVFNLKDETYIMGYRGFSQVSISTPGLTEYNEIITQSYDTSEPSIQVMGPGKPAIEVNEIEFSKDSVDYHLIIKPREKYLYIVDGVLKNIFEVLTSITDNTKSIKYLDSNGDMLDYTNSQHSLKVSASPNGHIYLSTQTDTDIVETSYVKIEWGPYSSGPEEYMTTDITHIYDEPINVNIITSQFASNTQITSTKSTKLHIETVGYHSNPSAFISKDKLVLQSSYSEHLPTNKISFVIPKYYVNVALENLDTLEIVYPNSTVKQMILNEKACVIVPKDSRISVDYTQMYDPCKFNILILEPSYLIKMQGTLNNPINRHRYLNMEHYLMELPYRHFNNKISNSIFSRTYENYDQTYKMVVNKDYEHGTFKYADGVVPLKEVKEYILPTKLVDENQKVLKLDTSSRLKVGANSNSTCELTTNEGFDVYGKTTNSKIEIKIPLLDTGKDEIYVSQNSSDIPTDMNLLTADKITIFTEDIKNDYVDVNDDVVVNDAGKITRIPTHIKSTDSSGSPACPIQATLKISEIPDVLKTGETRDKMLNTENVANPITLYTLGEAGWSNNGNYATKDTSDNLVNIFFDKVLVPKKGLEDFELTEEAWRVSFANMLRLSYNIPSSSVIENVLTKTDIDIFAKPQIRKVLDNATYTEHSTDATGFSDYFINGDGKTEKLTKSGIDALPITDEGKKLAYLTMQYIIGSYHTGVRDIIDFY